MTICHVQLPKQHYIPLHYYFTSTSSYCIQRAISMRPFLLGLDQSRTFFKINLYHNALHFDRIYVKIILMKYYSVIIWLINVGFFFVICRPERFDVGITQGH